MKIAVIVLMLWGSALSEGMAALNSCVEYCREGTLYQSCKRSINYRDISADNMLRCYTSRHDQSCPNFHYEFPKEDQVTNYVRYRSFFPQMYKAGTACMWFRPSIVTRYIPLASYAIDGYRNDNEFLIGIENDRVNIWITRLSITIPIRLRLRRSQQTHLCVWFSNIKRRLGIYVNGVDRHTASYNGGFVEGGGTLILGQEQDSNGGGFDPTQSYQGSITNFMVWPRKLTSSEISNISRNCTCPSDTSVVMSLDRAEIHGDTTYSVSQECPTL